jgi:hypothetical protein
VEPVVTKRIREDSVYYTVIWSDLRKADRHDISRSVPAVAGVYEIYYRDDRGTYHLFEISQAWYGGLRSQIREKIEPELGSDPVKREILSTKECFYRYTQASSREDILDLLFFFFETYFPKANRMQSSGRYRYIYVKEIARDKFIDQ